MPTPRSLSWKSGDAHLREIRGKKLVGKLGEDAGAVAGFGVGIHGAAVGEIAERLERELEDGIRFDAVLLSDEADAAGVVFKFRTVERRPDAGHVVLDDVVHKRCPRLFLRR